MPAGPPPAMTHEVVMVSVAMLILVPTRHSAQAGIQRAIP